MPNGKKTRNRGLAVASSGVIGHLGCRVANKRTAAGVIGARATSAECRTAKIGNVLAIFRRDAKHLLLRRCLARNRHGVGRVTLSSPRHSHGGERGSRQGRGAEADPDVEWLA